MASKINGTELQQSRELLRSGSRRGASVSDIVHRFEGAAARSHRKQSQIERARPLDRRTRPRPHLLEVDASSPAIEFVLLNLSPYGMSIETPRSLRIGQTYPIRIRHKRATVTVEGQVRWCRLDRTLERGENNFEPVYHAGFALETDTGKPISIPRKESSSPKRAKTVSGRYLFVGGSDGLIRQK